MPSVLHQYNTLLATNESIIAKALDSSMNSGGALIPQNLEQLITDTIQKLSPELAMVFLKKISGNLHEFNKILQRPGRGSAMGENATTPYSSSKTKKANVKLKIIRRKGKVTNFLIDTSEEYIDAAAYEMENHIQAHILDLIFYIVWGSEEANEYEFSGLEQFIKTNYIHFSKVAGGAVPTTLAFMNGPLDRSNRKGGAKHNRAYLMSPEMLSTVSLLMENVRLTQGLTSSGLTQVEVGGGWRLNAYRDLPIIETTSLSPIESLNCGVTLTGEATGGSLSDGDYFVYIAPMTQEGEQGPSPVQAITLSGGTATQRIKVDFDEPHYSYDYEGEKVYNVLGYKFFIGQITGHVNCPLRKQTGAFVYDAEGTPVGDLGVDESIYITTLTPGKDVPVHLQENIPLVPVDGVYPENIVFWDLDPIQGLGKVVLTNKPGDRFEGLVVTKPLAETDDFISFLTKSYLALTPSFEATSAWIRNIRRAD